MAVLSYYRILPKFNIRSIIMAKDPSFDIVSEVDMQVIDDVLKLQGLK